jgi:hypothetical protein
VLGRNALVLGAAQPRFPTVPNPPVRDLCGVKTTNTVAELGIRRVVKLPCGTR